MELLCGHAGTPRLPLPRPDLLPARHRPSQSSLCVYALFTSLFGRRVATRVKALGAKAVFVHCALPVACDQLVLPLTLPGWVESAKQGTRGQVGRAAACCNLCPN